MKICIYIVTGFYCIRLSACENVPHLGYINAGCSVSSDIFLWRILVSVSAGRGKLNAADCISAHGIDPGFDIITACCRIS